MSTETALSRQLEMGPGDECFELDSEKDWLDARRQGIGASEAPAILGVSPFKTALQIYAEKLELVEDAPADSERLEWGLLLEPPIAAKYQRVTGRQLRDPGRFTLRRSRSAPFMVTTLDREIVGGHGRATPGALEIKTTGYFKADDWQDEPPLHVQVQVQHQLAVTGWAWGSVAVLIGGQRFYWCDVERNDRFIALLTEREAAFYERLKRHEPPPLDGTASAAEILGRLYPRPLPGLVINLPPEAVEWDAELQAAKEAEKAAKAKTIEVSNRIKAAIGEAEMGVLQNGATYTWRTITKKAYAVDATTYRELRRKDGKV